MLLLLLFGVHRRVEKDPYPIHALPTCTHAHEVCQKDMSCTRLYADFKEHCKVRDGVCRDRFESRFLILQCFSFFIRPVCTVNCGVQQ